MNSNENDRYLKRDKHDYGTSNSNNNNKIDKSSFGDENLNLVASKIVLNVLRNALAKFKSNANHRDAEYGENLLKAKKLT